MKRLAILIALCIAACFFGQVQAQPSDTSNYKGFINVTALWLKPYADSLNALCSDTAVIPAFVRCACIDAHPPVFAGFHGSFRWMMLQQVTNKQLLLYLLHAPDAFSGRFKAVCTQGDNVRRLYSNRSFYGLIQMRYVQLVGL